VVAESMEHLPRMLQYEKWNYLIENYFKRKTNNATKKKIKMRYLSRVLPFISAIRVTSFFIFV